MPTPHGLPSLSVLFHLLPQRGTAGSFSHVSTLVLD